MYRKYLKRCLILLLYCVPAVICSILVLVTLCGIKIINNILKNENSNSFWSDW